MATGGFAPNEPAPSSPATNQSMTKEKDLLMRLIYLTRRTCDQLSRDLTKYVIDELHQSNWDDWLRAADPDDLKLYKTYFKRHFGDKIPPLDECDTTTLTDMLSRYIIPEGGERGKKFKPYIDKLRELRNKVSHGELETGVTEPEFRDELVILQKYLLGLLNDPISQPIFPSIRSCLGFLSRNKTMTLEQFCTYYPNEITTFRHSLEPVLRTIAKTIPCLTERVNKHEILLEEMQKNLACFKSSTDNRLENVETKVENVETELENVETKLENMETELENLQLTRQMSTQLPSDSLRPFSVSGRQNALDTLETSLVNEQIALIYGPPGIGKTAFANCFGQKISSETQVSIEVSFDDFNLQQEKPVDLIARKVGCNFPGLLADLETTQYPLSRLEEHIRDVLRERKLLLIFDNIDNVINLRDAAGHETGREALETVTTKLLATGEGLKILFTARNQTFDPEPYNCFPMKLEPLSQEACEDWLSDQKSQIEKKILEEISICCDGIPLILSILFKVVKKYGKTEEIEKIKRSNDKLKKSLELSFDMLTEDQLIIMLCAAAFNGNFDAETLDSLFIKVKPTHSSDNRSSLIRDCRDLSLFEYDDGKQKYFLHPYIKEFVRATYSRESEQKAIDENFVLTYFEKCLLKARQQLEEKNSFCSVVNSLVADSQNIFKFFEILSDDAAPMLTRFVRLDETSAYWLLASFWLLNKIGRFKKISFELAEKLEQIFTRSKNYAQAILCKCFLSHCLRLLQPRIDNASMSRTKIDEADGLLSEMQKTTIQPFCQGYLAYTMARFNQHVSNWAEHEKLPFDVGWGKDKKLFERSLTAYSSWKKPHNLKRSLFENICTLEIIQVLLFQYREILPKIPNEHEKDDCFRYLNSCIKHLIDKLGAHEEVAFATRKTAVQLKFNGRSFDAVEYYSNAYKMYQLFGPEIEIQQVILLKEWSDCLPVQEAIEKLQFAKQILEQNYMTNTAWYRQIKKRLKTRQKQQKTPEK